MTFIATFYSHFGATVFRRDCQAVGVTAKPMPVPRDLSSSCGTCVLYESDSYCPIASVPEDVEQIVEVKDGGYQLCYKAADS